jgi:hypothetical protein
VLGVGVERGQLAQVVNKALWRAMARAQNTSKRTANKIRSFYMLPIITDSAPMHPMNHEVFEQSIFKSGSGLKSLYCFSFKKI